jgi:hypothetical protein
LYGTTSGSCHETRSHTVHARRLPVLRLHGEQSLRVVAQCRKRHGALLVDRPLADGLLESGLPEESGPIMKKKLQRWLKLWAVRQLRNLVDLADERVHGWEVRLRKSDLWGPRDPTPVQVDGLWLGPTYNRHFNRHNLEAREARENRLAPPKRKRRCGITASAFDLRFSR